MSISYPETIPLTCPRCGTTFTNETYIIVDGVERPDLVQRILDDSLHNTECPNCGQTGRVAAPLLYHDGLSARVLLGVPPDMPENEWREIGQTLLWTLIGALPEAQRLPYLGDVQAEAGLAGVAQIIEREQLAGWSDAQAEEIPPIVPAIQALLAANGPDALQQVFVQHPILQEPQAVTILQELAAEAIKHGQMEAADGFARAADLLEQVKQMRDSASATPISIVVDTPHLSPDALENLAFALLRSTTGQEIAQVVDDHPALLEAWADDALLAYAAEARRQNKQRVADGLVERVEAIRRMRQQYQAQQPVLEAVQAYLQAETGDAVEQVILDHEALTSDEADRALDRLAQSARDEGDAAFAVFVENRRAFLRQVRAALDEANET